MVDLTGGGILFINFYAGQSDLRPIYVNSSVKKKKFTVEKVAYLWFDHCMLLRNVCLLLISTYTNKTTANPIEGAVLQHYTHKHRYIYSYSVKELHDS